MFRLAPVVVAVLSFAGVAHADEPVTDTPKADAPKSDAPKSDSTKKSTTTKKSSTKKSKTSSKKSSTKSDKTAAKGDGKTSTKTDGDTTKSDGKTTTTAKAKKSTKGKAPTRSKKSAATKGKTEARVPWIPTRNTLANTQNLPNGFSWPPSQPMLEAEKQCEAKLDRAGVQWERAGREGRIVDAIVVPSMVFGGIKYTNMWGSKGPHTLDCQLALALETIGPELHALGVREVKYGSIFRWSNVRSGGVTRPYLSRHGLGLAMDIGSFVDEAGREAVVETDYKKDDPMLHGIEELINANGNFRIVLTPKNDPISHHNHFHIEAKSNYTSAELP